jgi:hypothetical protein
VAQQLQAILGVASHDLNGDIGVDFAGEIIEFAVNAYGNGVTSKALADTGSYFGTGGGGIVLPGRAVG